MSTGPFHCPTCADAAVTARVTRVDGADAIVTVDGVSERVAIDLVPDARPGDLLLCHAGVALQPAGADPATP